MSFDKSNSHSSHTPNFLETSTFVDVQDWQNPSDEQAQVIAEAVHSSPHLKPWMLDENYESSDKISSHVTTRTTSEDMLSQVDELSNQQ